VFLEAGLARGQAPQGDLKSLLLMLRGAFATQGENAPSPRAETAAQNREALLPRAAQAQSSGDLMRLVEGAVERIKLNQLASLPELPGMRVTDERPQGFQLTTTIPLATQGLDRPQTAAIGMMIEHHPVETGGVEIEADEETADDAQGFPWKVRIALDLEETGPVQAEIALRGQTVAITLWAERRAIADLARREIGALHDKLTEAAFDVSRLEVKDGRPVGAAPRATRVLDQRT
jgi:hypothetical protein